MDEFIYLKTDKSKILFNEFTYVKYRDAETLEETTYRCLFIFAAVITGAAKKL
jgi:hypothetical protein